MMNEVESSERAANGNCNQQRGWRTLEKGSSSRVLTRAAPLEGQLLNEASKDWVVHFL